MTAAKFTKCVLHIGTEKTGTTTLQAFLGQNREVLDSRGYFVPRSLSPYAKLANHERLTTHSLLSEKLNDDLRRAAGLSTVEQVLAHKQKVKLDFGAEVERKVGDRKFLLLSNEHCHSRLVLQSEVQSLHDLLSEFADDFQVIVYLRPQHELATSLYDQALKAGYFDIPVLPNFASTGQRWIERKYFDYQDLLSRWEKVFGSEKILARLFIRDELRGGSIVNDFLEVIDCKADDELSFLKNENTSISAAHQSSLNAINRFASQNPHSVSPLLRARIISRLSQLSSTPGRRPTRSAAIRFFQQFSESNELVRQRYFPSRSSLFDINFSDLPDVEPELAPEVDSLVKTILSSL